MNLENLFIDTPAEQFKLIEKRNGIYQIIAPLFHEDGDMMNILISDYGNNQVKIFDGGMSLMRLSYTFDLDTPNKNKLLEKTLKVRSATNENGVISTIVSKNRIYTAIIEFSQLINNVCNLDILTRGTITSLFYENLQQEIEYMVPDNLIYSYKPDFIVPSYRDLKVDYVFEREGRTPIYLFGVKDTNKAQQVTICCLQLIRQNVTFKSSVVFENMDEDITRFARNNLVNTVGKVFSDLEGFKATGKLYLDSELNAS